MPSVMRFRADSSFNRFPENSDAAKASFAPPSVVKDLVSQVFDLGQSNWRGFNALSRPVSILYSELIAELLGHGIVPDEKVRAALSTKLWFL